MRLLFLNSRLLLLALLWDPSNCQSVAPSAAPVSDEIATPTVLPVTDPPTFACFICGEGKGFGNPGKMVTTNLGIFTCAGLVGAGLMGNIPEEQCSAMQSIASENCNCETDEPTEAPLEASYVCSICSDDMVVTRPLGIVYIPSQEENRTCAEYGQESEAGGIQEAQCGLLQQYTNEPCGCEAPLHSACPICGEDMMVGDPGAFVQLPTGENGTCAELETGGNNGQIPETQCGGLQAFVMQICQCEREETDVPEPTAAPVVALTAAPVAALTEASAPAVALTEGMSAIPSDFPSLVPTSLPGPTDATPTDGCFDNLADIHALEMSLEDASLRRKYILCPGKTFNMGILDSEGIILEGEPFIMIRPNVIYQCGQDGSRLNNCILKGGDYAVTSYYGVFEGIYETVENVEIKGLTFHSQNLFAAVMESAGDITFTDCAFRMHGNMVPVLMQWKGSGPETPADGLRNLRKSAGPSAVQLFHQRRMQSPPTSNEIESVLEARRSQGNDFNHVVTFQDCVFRDNFVGDNMGFPGIIENTFASELNIINCLFQDNAYGDTKNNPAPFGYAIRSFGPLTVESSCFIDNTFFNHGPIEVYGTSYTATNNHVTSSQADLDCEFIALFTSQDQMTNDSPICIDADAGTCAFSQPPTVAPTVAPPTRPPSFSSTDSLGTDGSRASTIRTVFIGLISLVLTCLM